MDIQMPNMNGYQAAEAIRALPGKRGEIPIVAMTANAFEEDRRKALESGMTPIFAKPVDVSVSSRNTFQVFITLQIWSAYEYR